MDEDPLFLQTRQPFLFDLGAPSQGMVELFPAVWVAAEALTSTDKKIRQSGIERLRDLNAGRFSALVAYMLITRLSEPDLSMRAEVISLLADILKPDELGRPAPEEVRRNVMDHLAQMRTRRIYALLQTADYDPGSCDAIAVLLDACPFGGGHLIEILANRKVPLSIRKQAAFFIGRVGFLDAIPAMERIQSRLETRLEGQQSMPFAPVQHDPDEVDLLPTVREALAALHAP